MKRTARMTCALASLLLAADAPSQEAIAPTRASASGISTSDLYAHIAAREYWASAGEQGLQAPNRAHGLRTRFDADGIRVADRTASGAPELVALRLAAFGRAGSQRTLPPGQVTSAGPRVEIRRGQLVEWYVNGPAGLEQGFTLAEPPAGERPLFLDLVLAGASASLVGGTARLQTASGRRLDYGGLVALDATGAELRATIEVPAPDRLRLVVDDAGAVYPVVIDPLLTQTPDAQLESDQAGPGAVGDLGTSVAGAGDVNGDGYDDVIVGAPSYDAGQSKEGAAFVFLGGPSGLADGDPLTAATQLEGDQLSAQLGISVAGAGDVNGDGYGDVIVGANRYDAGQTDEGAAFVFLGSPNGVASAGAAAAHARLEGNQAGAQMGASVAGAGDVNGDGYADVIVGAPFIDAGQTDEGAAFVFEGAAAGIGNGSPSTADAAIQADQTSAQLGFSVASAGDVNGDGYDDVIVGAPLYTFSQPGEGGAFIFEGSAAGLPITGNPSMADTALQGEQPAAEFGRSVAGAGDVDADGYDDVIVGAPLAEVDQTDEGMAFVFHGSATGVKSDKASKAMTVLEGMQANADVGRSVAGAGDVNRDGYDDVVVGVPLGDAGETDEGLALIFLGGSSGVATTIAYQVELNQAGAKLGSSVAGAGDVNASTYADVIVGAPLYDAGESNEGAAFVYLGGSWDPIALPRVYHSPADDGVPAVSNPPSLPGGSTTLHLYIAESDPGAPSSAPGMACQPLFAAWGAERCGWDLEIDVDGGLTLAGFTPNGDVVAAPALGTRFRLNGGSYAAGELGPVKIGDLIVEGGDGTVWLRSGTVAGARIDRIVLGPAPLVLLPEPQVGLALGAGALTLALLRRRRGV